MRFDSVIASLHLWARTNGKSLTQRHFKYEKEHLGISRCPDSGISHYPLPGKNEKNTIPKGITRIELLNRSSFKDLTVERILS
ncbi:hypothetical protein Csa_020826 [Cucumis sativus]|nr:hypothetical protein Csa_020826 [Cucumis sativus]